MGKSNKPHPKDKDGDGNASDEDYIEDEDDVELSKVEIKPVYNKDDFFDTISCNAMNHEQNGRTRYSEQIKIDTEVVLLALFQGIGVVEVAVVLGVVAVVRGGYYGRGYGGYGGYGGGYVGRGRGRAMPTRAP
ncbi:protein decapping 5 isoform X1 [Prunus yedoensis var. nudiflora]|uniref:Protein decapping 5 isoform X1 n=1 Tax=Prunus yedoensis var. nudiflora TaxID=2094558 RepID=A0A314UB98_PRUYE|nr:protein decapping 5 isoform X1 [Prunus yedoensis var. nudiflora]